MRAPFDAVVFDLDGVVTDTASIHARAWRRLFDSELPAIAPERAEPFTQDDYRTYIDGKSREQGIAAFLASRGAQPPGMQATALIERLGTKKQLLFEAELAEHGVRPIDDTIGFAESVRAAGMCTALATSSRNAALIVRAAGVTDLFDVIVDGNDALDLGLSSKPGSGAVPGGLPAPRRSPGTVHADRGLGIGRGGRPFWRLRPRGWVWQHRHDAPPHCGASVRTSPCRH